jgi:hypothetical protein
VFVNPQTKQTIPGFYGYLLTLHETLNAFTGKIGGGGWPTDWWADHRSPFPNAMDEQVMRYIGNAQNNRTLKDAAEAQHVRFALPDQKSYDRQVVMFDKLFDQFGGFDGLSRFFRLVEEDGIRWPVVGHDATFSGDDNHSEQLSEYVIAYLSLGFETKKDLTPVFVEYGVGTDDKKIPSYKLNPAAVKAIADAHCSIHAASAAGLVLAEAAAGRLPARPRIGRHDPLMPERMRVGQGPMRCEVVGADLDDGGYLERDEFPDHS